MSNTIEKLFSAHLRLKVRTLFTKSGKNNAATQKFTANENSCKTKYNSGKSSCFIKKMFGKNSNGRKMNLMRFINLILYRFLIPLSVILTLTSICTQSMVAKNMAVTVMLIGVPMVFIVLGDAILIRLKYKKQN